MGIVKITRQSVNWDGMCKHVKKDMVQIPEELASCLVERRGRKVPLSLLADNLPFCRAGNAFLSLDMLEVFYISAILVKSIFS